jgi:glycosyltransferase involved in cell wall biosynthesis
MPAEFDQQARSGPGNGSEPRGAGGRPADTEPPRAPHGRPEQTRGMACRRKLSICYVVPGHSLLSTVGPTRNVLSLAGALARHAEVTVAFRHVLDDQAPAGLRVVEIQPGARLDAAIVDDAAMRGLGYREFLGYLRDLRGFAERTLPAFDVVLEKSWLLSGYLSTLCRRRGRLGVPIENFVPNPAHNAANSMAKRLRIEVGQRIAGYHLRRAPLLIAETEHLKRGIVRKWRVPEERIAVVGLGVDRALFAPHDQAAARRQLEMASDRAVLVYSGVVDATHDLGPLLAAMARVRAPAIEVHVIGDGVLRAKHEAAARASGINVVFHGRVAHERVPIYLAAADLCLAPYDPTAFSSGELGYSSMKVPEYLSAGRPVVTVPSGRLRDLVHHGKTGFLMANQVEDWMRFLNNCPDRDTLRAMGEAAAKVELMSWNDTAEAYLELCERQLAAAAGSPAA